MLNAFPLSTERYLKLALDVPELFLGFSCLAVGVTQLDLHLIQISLHLLFDSQGIISAPDLSVQCALHGFDHSLAVPLDLFHLLILLRNLPVDLALHLVQLQLHTKNLGLFMLQSALVDSLRKNSINLVEQLCNVHHVRIVFFHGLTVLITVLQLLQAQSGSLFSQTPLSSLTFPVHESSFQSLQAAQ